MCLGLAAVILLALSAACDEKAPPVQSPAAERLSASNAMGVGHWNGELRVTAGLKLRLVLHVEAAKAPSTTLTALLDSPDQGAKGLPVNLIEVQDGKLVFELKEIGARFEGELNKAGNEAKGIWSQGPAKLPITFKKSDTPSLEPKRPQTPQGIPPYRAEAVKFENKAAAATLAGTLTLPRGDGPFPAALLITGSGPQDRDETIFAHKPFLVIADALTRRGVAVLRYDDRGVAESTGSSTKATSADFADDALAGIAYLKSRRDVDPNRIGIIGHSEGGIIAAMIAAETPSLAFIVMLAGTGVPGDDIVRKQLVDVLKSTGADAAAVKKAVDFQSTALDIAEREIDPRVADAKLRKLGEDVLKDEPDEIRTRMKPILDQQLGMLVSPWFRYFLAFDPGPALSKTRCPVLALNGEKDTQVDASVNLTAIRAALGHGKNPDATTRALPGLNHLFQPCKTGSPQEYVQIETTFEPTALKLLSDWVVEHTLKTVPIAK